MRMLIHYLYCNALTNISIHVGQGFFNEWVNCYCVLQQQKCTIVECLDIKTSKQTNKQANKNWPELSNSAYFRKDFQENLKYMHVLGQIISHTRVAWSD